MQKQPSSLYFKLLLLAICLASSSAWATSQRDSYIPPEIAFAEELQQKVKVSQQLNLNTMNLVELQTLPGFSEDLALKIIRQRPFSDFQDFYHRMPSVSNQQLKIFIQQFQSKLKF